MEATITQSGALYLAQHRSAENRRAFFQPMRSAGWKKAFSPRLLRTLVQRPLRHRDNGR